MTTAVSTIHPHPSVCVLSYNPCNNNPVDALSTDSDTHTGDGPIVLILAPTRELASQIYVEATKFAKPHGAKVMIVIAIAIVCLTTLCLVVVCV